MAGNDGAQLGVGMVGYSFMGAAHSQAWRTAPRFFDLPLDPRMRVLGGRNPEALAAAAQRLGWESTETSWQALVARDAVDLVDVCTPGDTHAEIAIAALEAGKHVLCEKPLANTVAEAEKMVAVAEAAAARGQVAMVGFTYRRVPAIQLARQLVADGRIGTVRHVRAQYLQDWIADENAPLSWRLDKSKAGSGALGDIGAHVIDLAQFITGEKITPSAAWKLQFEKPNSPPIQPSTPLASATRATKASTIAPTATASLTPVWAPCAAASITLAGACPSSNVSASATSCGFPPSTSAPGPSALMRASGSSIGPSASGSGSAGSGMMILAIRIPPGADMNAAASRNGR